MPPPDGQELTISYTFSVERAEQRSRPSHQTDGGSSAQRRVEVRAKSVSGGGGGGMTQRSGKETYTTLHGRG